MRLSQRPRPRHGAAVVEFAVIMPVLMVFLLGTWELGRLVQVYAIMSHAAREGARIAAQGQIINLTGAYTKFLVSDSNANNPDVTKAVQNYLVGTGIRTTGTPATIPGLTVAFTYLDNAGNPVSSPTQPWQGTKGQRFRVTVYLPYTTFRISTTNLCNITGIQVSVDWVSMIDDPFQLNTTLPSWNPLS